MYEDLEKLLKKEKEYCQQKYREVGGLPPDDYPTEYIKETPAYWLGRIAEIEIVLGFIEG